MTSEALLSLNDLTIQYPTSGRNPRPPAVSGVSLAVADGRTVGLVGESGSGKSTVGKAILGMVAPASGVIEFAGEDITRADPRRRRELSREIQVVFQDPYSSLNPSRTIAQTMVEPLLGRGFSRKERLAKARASLEDVGLPHDALNRYPGQFSGGQRQRIAIARALIVEPRLVICDEPVSGLDLSVQAQVLNLLTRLQRDRGVAYLFITHDISVVRHVSHEIAVMERGRIVEAGAVQSVLNHPEHPYTSRLLAAAPIADPHRVGKSQGAGNHQDADIVRPVSGRVS